MSNKKYILLMLFIASCQGLTLPKIYMDGMVLQGAPSESIIWGYLDGNTGSINLSADCGDGNTVQHELFPNKGDTEFKFKFLIEKEKVCDIIIEQGEKLLSLNDIHFGDVWVCSGQSNMGFSMGGIFNVDEELEKMTEYPNIKMFKVKMMTASEPQNDLMEYDWTKWVSVNEVYVRQFSAVCLLTARYMADELGKNKTFGLIQSAWGGTRIEPWSTPEGLEFCGVEPHVDEDSPNTSNSYLFNAMIYPLTKLNIYGALWYQGESNMNWNTDKYACTFGQMIKEWRRIWFENTELKCEPDFPFGFVQLAAIGANNPYLGVPTIRSHQRSVHYDIQDAFMAVSLDTFDEEGQIHPRNKQLPSKRLATAGLNAAYRLYDYPVNGPEPSVINFEKLEDGIQVDITYDQSFIWDPTETEGFYICTEKDVSTCNNIKARSLWQKLPPNSVISSGMALSMKVNLSTIALAYLWETTPVLGTEALPIYADNVYKLPGAPWMTVIDLE